MTTFGMVSLLAGVGIVSRWSHLHAEVLSQPTALIGVAVGFLTVLTWLLFTLRCVRLARVGAVLAAVAAVGDLAVYATSIREPGSAPPVALAMLLVAFLVFQAIVLRAVDLPRGDTTDTTLPELSKPFALPFKVLAYGLAYSALWATLNNGAHLFNGRPLAAIHYGTAGLGFTVAGALSKRSTAASAALACWLLIASAAGTSMTDTVVSLALMLALVCGWPDTVHRRPRSRSPSTPDRGCHPQNATRQLRGHYDHRKWRIRSAHRCGSSKRGDHGTRVAAVLPPSPASAAPPPPAAPELPPPSAPELPPPPAAPELPPPQPSTSEQPVHTPVQPPGAETCGTRPAARSPMTPPTTANPSTPSNPSPATTPPASGEGANTAATPATRATAPAVVVNGALTWLPTANVSSSRNVAVVRTPANRLRGRRRRQPSTPTTPSAIPATANTTPTTVKPVPTPPTATPPLTRKRVTAARPTR